MANVKKIKNTNNSSISLRSAKGEIINGKKGSGFEVEYKSNQPIAIARGGKAPYHAFRHDPSSLKNVMENSRERGHESSLVKYFTNTSHENINEIGPNALEKEKLAFWFVPLEEEHHKYKIKNRELDYQRRLKFEQDIAEGICRGETYCYSVSSIDSGKDI